MIMRKHLLATILVIITVSLIGTAQATIVSLSCGPNPQISELHTRSWSFDYDLQQLTAEVVIYKTDPEWPASLGIVGLVDDRYSDSTFGVELTITNETGIEWIGYKFVYGPLWIGLGSAYIIPGSIETTKLQTITDTTWGLLFSEPPAVFDGESFTISYDMRTGNTAHTNDGTFMVWNGHIPVYVPEPATIVLFGIGGLASIRRRSAFNKRHKIYKE